MAQGKPFCKCKVGYHLVVPQIKIACILYFTLLVHYRAIPYYCISKEEESETYYNSQTYYQEH